MELSKEMQASIFQNLSDRNYSEQANAISDYLYTSCELEKNNTEKLTSAQQDCVSEGSLKLWAFFKSSDAKLNSLAAQNSEETPDESE